MERALILAEGGLLTAAHFGVDRPGTPGIRGGASQISNPAVPEALADQKQRPIRAALEQTKGNKSRAAALLGITRTQLHTRLKRYGLASESSV